MDLNKKFCRVSLFSPGTELLNLYLPLIFVPLLLYDYFYFAGVYTPAFKHYIIVLAAYGFFNATHNALTFIVIFLFPEGIQWMKSPLSMTRVPMRTFVLVMLFALLLLGLALSLGLGMNGKFLFPTLVILRIFLGLHIWGQFRGFCALYNYATKAQMNLSPDQLEKFRVHETIEKWVFGAGIFFISTKVLLTMTRHSSQFVHAGIVAAVAGLLINALLYPKVAVNKLIYLLRVSLVPFGASNLSAEMTLRSLHGVEYVCIYQKMRNRTDWGVPAWIGIGSFLLAILVSGIAHYPGYFTDPDIHRFMYLTLALNSLQYMIEFGHYILDALIFRFNRPEVAGTIGKLLRPLGPNTQPLTASTSIGTCREPPWNSRAKGDTTVAL